MQSQRRCQPGADRCRSRAAQDEGDRPDAPLSHRWMLIALRGPIARASRTSRVAAPSSATGRPEKPARAGRKFVLNRHRRTNRTRSRDVSPESYQVGMGHNAVGNIDGEVVTGIAWAPLRHEDKIPGAIIGGSRVCDRYRGHKADCCNHPERTNCH